MIEVKSGKQQYSKWDYLQVSDTDGRQSMIEVYEGVAGVYLSFSTDDPAVGTSAGIGLCLDYELEAERIEVARMLRKLADKIDREVTR